MEGADPGTIALVADDRLITRGELSDLIAARRIELALPDRSLVVLTGQTSLEWVVTYLALLAARHVPLLASDHVERLTGAWSPAAVVEATPGGVVIERRHEAVSSEVELHDDLALLLSTSGSTGVPKLVRLSHRNLVEQRTSDRRLPPAPSRRSGHHVTAAALLLRIVGHPFPPDRRCERRAHRCIGRRPVLPRRTAPPPRDEHRRGAPHVPICSSGSAPSRSMSRRCDSSPRLAADCPPPT